jgi:Protein of unknown function (DUF1344)
MRNVILVVLAALVVGAPAASAQLMEPSSPPDSRQGSPDGTSPHMDTLVAVEGKIQSVDLSQGTLTLDDGTQFVLPSSFQYTSYPRVGDEVQVTYAQDGAQKVVRILDINTPGDSSNGGSD